MELTKDQKELILKLVQDSTTMLSLYYDLILHENNKDNESYKQTILNIKEFSLKFKAYVDKLNIKKEQYDNFLKYLEKFGSYLSPEIVDDLVYEEGISLIIKRIVNGVKEDLIVKGDFFYIERKIAFFTELINNSFNEYFDDLQNYIILKFQFEDDMRNIFLSYIDELILEEENSDVKEELTTIKYRLIYLNPSCESYFLSSYILGEELNLSSKFVADLLKIDPEYYSQLKDEFIFDNVEQSLTQLLVIDEEDLNNPDYQKEVVLRLKLILSLLVMSEDRTINDIHDAFDEEINNSFLGEKIIEIFSSFEKEKEKYRVLSYKPIKDYFE